MSVLFYLSTLPTFIMWFMVVLGFMAAYHLIYVYAITPYNEYRLISEGNLAAAYAFAGSMLGYVIPLATAMIYASTKLDLVSWAIVALVIQSATFLVFWFIYRDMPKQIENDNRAVGVFVGVLSLSVGILNASTMVY